MALFDFLRSKRQRSNPLVRIIEVSESKDKTIPKRLAEGDPDQSGRMAAQRQPDDLRSKWHHPQPDVRKQAIAILTDESNLQKLAESDPDDSVREAALKRLIDILASQRNGICGNTLACLCFDGYLKLPISIGTSGRTIAVIHTIRHLITRTDFSLIDFDRLVCGVCGTVKRGIDGKSVLPHLKELQKHVASFNADTFVTPLKECHAVAERYGEYKCYVAGTFKGWCDKVSAAVISIEATPT